MLNNIWYAIEFSAAVTQKPQAVTLMGQSLVLYRDSQGQVIALSDRCAHRGAALSLGWVEDNCLRCPYHGWSYQSNGQCADIPANQPGMAIPKRARVATYPVKEANGFVWIFWGSLPEQQRPPLPALSQFDSSQWYGTQDQFDWNASYTRVIENNVDVSHPPFVHRRLGQRKDQNAQIAELKVEPVGEWGASVTISAKMAKIKGFWQMLVAQQEEIGSTRRHAFYLPNFTTLELSFGQFKLAFLMAHVPVAADITITKSIVLRNFLKFSWLDQSVNRFGRKLLQEDEAVVKTQIPQSIESDLSQEVLVASDAMILAYRKLYKKHQQSDSSLGQSVVESDAAPVIYPSVSTLHSSLP